MAVAAMLIGACAVALVFLVIFFALGVSFFIVSHFKTQAACWRGVHSGTSELSFG